MKCPYCGEVDSKVIDSRPTEDGEKIRRRRECLNCKKRFTTYEIVETVPLMVVSLAACLVFDYLRWRAASAMRLVKSVD